MGAPPPPPPPPAALAALARAKTWMRWMELNMAPECATSLTRTARTAEVSHSEMETLSTELEGGRREDGVSCVRTAVDSQQRALTLCCCLEGV